MPDSFGSRSRLTVGDRAYDIHRLDAVVDEPARLPYALRVLLENLLRGEDGETVTADDVAALASWDPRASPGREVLFTPARVLLQDFTGVPAVVDLAAMRDAVAELGGDPAAVDAQLPADLVIDHSIIAEVAGIPEAFRRNAEIEFQRNLERYQFLRWGQQAFQGLRVVPPNTGIVHQVNLEYLGQVVCADQAGAAYPDTLVGTDSHTPMINGLGVLGWGVGGIEAEACMLGQPISLATPEVVGLKLTGELPQGTTATDLVLTITELLRGHGVVGKFVEAFGPGVGQVPLEHRATIGNMSPEYGSTVTLFPIDAETLRYLRFTGRDEQQVALVEAYTKAQGLFHDPSIDPAYTDIIELDLSTVVPSLAGPTRPQDRVALTEARRRFRAELPRFVSGADADEVVEESFPASDPPAYTETERPHNPVEVTTAEGERVTLDHGHVAIAAITSCTNTSNPQVMMAAGLLAKKAVERGLATKPWVKASLAPGSKVVMDYYERAGLLPYLEKLRFVLVGYGCTTCIGNSGPLAPEISQAAIEHDLALATVLSGNRNFEGRINPDCKMNYLASPPLVVAFALAGSIDVDLYREPLGRDPAGTPVSLADIWPTRAQIDEVVRDSVQQEMFRKRYADVFRGDERWRSLEVPSGQRAPWDPGSTYVRKPPFFDGLGLQPAPLTDVVDARVLVLLGDSVTTDHISPAGAIKADSPAGQWLIEHGVDPADFNSFGARRGNHEVMLRGTFGNIRLRNLLAPGTEGGVTVKLPEEIRMPIYDAAMRYAEQGTPLVVLAGREYGSGSSRDWAAKGPSLLGVRTVIAKSYERIHRSNLIGMGVLPLEFADGESIASLGLTGRERFTVRGLAGAEAETMPSRVTVVAESDGGARTEFAAVVRIDTTREAEYYRHGGILPYVLRQLAAG
jgi:aconitate hydratase